MSEKKDKPAGKPDLTLTAYNAIRQMLFYNEIHPGQKIKYKDLAGRIGVSMTPVIQALKWLEFRNIVRHEPNRGYYINEISLKEIAEVYNTRLLIEVALVSDVMARLDETGIKNSGLPWRNTREPWRRTIITSASSRTWSFTCAWLPWQIPGFS